MSNISTKSVFSNMLWRLAERCGAQGVSFIVSVVLARLLLPEEYGVISLITVFTSILNLFTDCGFTNALIQKKDADQLDFSTVFYFNIFMGVALYGMMFVASPAIARFYEKEYIIPYIRVLSLTLVLGSINGVQNAIVSIRMQFKRFFYATLGGTIISAFIGIWMAYHGMGVWALITQQLTNQLIDTIILWLTVRWHPTLEFSVERLKPLFQYGGKLLVSSVLDRVALKLTSLIIGKIYSTKTLAYYEKSDRIPSLLLNNLSTSVQSVLFPVMSQQQDQRKEVKKILKRFLKTSSYVIFPCMVGLAICAKPIIRLLYTEKWVPMVPYMQLCCISYLPWMMHTGNLQVIQALGRSDLFLRLELIKQIVGIIYLILVIPFGVLPLLIVDTVFSFICVFINGYYSKKLIDYSIWAQIFDVLPILFLSLAMGLIVSAVGFLSMPDFPKLVLQVTTGITVYIGGSIILRLESFYYTLKTVKEVLFK